MEDHDTAETNESRLEVPAEATIRNAAEFKDSLLEAIRRSSDLVLDLSRVESVDMSFFQIFGAGQRLAGELGKTLSLDQQGASGAVREAVKAAGFSRHAGCFGDAEDICLWKEED